MDHAGALGDARAGDLRLAHPAARRVASLGLVSVVMIAAAAAQPSGANWSATLGHAAQELGNGQLHADHACAHDEDRMFVGAQGRATASADEAGVGLAFGRRCRRWRSRR